IASSCSMMASMCQPGMSGVDGSRTCQTNSTKSFRLRLASSPSISLTSVGLDSKSFKLLEFFIGELREVWFGRNLDRTAGRTTVLVAEVVFVAKNILGKKDGAGDVARIRLTKQNPA